MQPMRMVSFGENGFVQEASGPAPSRMAAPPAWRMNVLREWVDMMDPFLYVE
jgi:hypothetical protein